MRSRAGGRSGLSADALAGAVQSLRIELVLTAHPTEMVRRTLLQMHRRIGELLAVRDRSDLTPEESDAAIDDLRREIATMWQTEEVRDQAVSPLDEVRSGLAVFEQTLWEALPRYVRQIDRALGEPLPLDAAPLRFGSWIGGDRDGNPNVTPEVTRKAAWMARWMAADLYSREIDALRAELSIGVATDELREVVGDTAEPYRALLRDVAARLRATRAYAAAEIEHAGAGAVRSRAPFLDGRGVRGAAAALPSLARRDRQRADRRRPPDRYSSTRRRIRAGPGPARPASGRGPPCRGGGVDRAGLEPAARTRTRPKRSASRC